jgi:hypothetical protein
MDQLTPLIIVLTVFVGITAISFVVMAVAAYRLQQVARAMQTATQRVLPKVEALAESSRVAVEDSRVKIAEVTTKTTDILDTTRRQLARVEEVLDDAASRARVQLDRAEIVVDDAVTRAQETVIAVQSGILRPLKEINGVAVGLRAAIQYFLRGGRPNPDQVTADEEMFI